LDRMIEICVGGKKLLLNYSIGCMLDLEERYGTAANALELIGGEGRDSIGAAVFLAEVMAASGELVRRRAGLEKREIPTRGFYYALSPAEFGELKLAVLQAVTAGYRREASEPEKDERDLGLEELEAQKKANAGEDGASYSISLLQSCT